MNLIDIVGPVMVSTVKFTYCGSREDRAYFQKALRRACS